MVSFKAVSMVIASAYKVVHMLAMGDTIDAIRSEGKGQFTYCTQSVKESERERENEKNQ